MSNVMIPFELFADLFEYFFGPGATMHKADLEENIKEGLKKKAVAIIRREDYAERIRQASGASQQDQDQD